MTRVMLLGDNQICADAARILVAHGAEIVALGLHAPERRRAAREIQDVVPGVPVFGPDPVRAASDEIFALRPELAVSVFYGHILRPRFLDRVPTVNLHPALLPWNRGAYPNVWSIVEGTPAGVTLHEVDPDVDTGPILAQLPVHKFPWDTGRTLYDRLLEACRLLMEDVAADLLAGRLRPSAQVGAGSAHRARDVEAIDRLDLESTMSVGAVLDRLRARTFPPHRGCWFEADGRRIYVSVSLEPEQG